MRKLINGVMAVIYFAGGMVVGYAALAAAAVHPGTAIPGLLAVVSASTFAMGFLFLVNSLPRVKRG